MQRTQQEGNTAHRTLSKDPCGGVIAGDGVASVSPCGGGVRAPLPPTTARRLQEVIGGGAGAPPPPPPQPLLAQDDLRAYAYEGDGSPSSCLSSAVLGECCDVFVCVLPGVSVVFCVAGCKF